jgi:hypothetical protein
LILILGGDHSEPYDSMEDCMRSGIEEYTLEKK